MLMVLGAFGCWFSFVLAREAVTYELVSPAGVVFFGVLYGVAFLAFASMFVCAAAGWWRDYHDD